MNRKNVVTPAELFEELKKFIGSKEGFKNLKRGRDLSNQETAYYIRFEGQIFSLRVDTKATAVFNFVQTAKNLGAAKALKLIRNKNGKRVLRVNDGKGKADGWYCYLYSQEKETETRRAA